jgi:hypothetical protein
MDTHLAYPTLAYFRSQHLSQNWLSALTTILDTCAFRIAASGMPIPGTAERTLAIGRHALADLAYTLRARTGLAVSERLHDGAFDRLYAMVQQTGVPLAEPSRVKARLDELRSTYEPQAQALGDRLALALPTWLPSEAPRVAEPIHQPRLS